MPPSFVCAYARPRTPTHFEDLECKKTSVNMRATKRHTVSSYGIICHRLKIDFNARSVHPEFLLVQRKDSMAFVEFVRGKYVPDNHEYVRHLVSEMTTDEQQLVATQPFDVLWKIVWGGRPPSSSRYSVELVSSRRAHETLVELWGGTLTKLINTTPGCLAEREYGFPKGRKSGGESDLNCAVREFQEETGVDTTCIHLYNLRPQEEIFEGGNGILYRHVYFVARMVDMRGGPRLEPRAGTIQAQEVGRVKWMTFAEMCSKFERSQSRLSVATRANDDIFRVLDPDPECVKFNAMSIPEVVSLRDGGPINVTSEDDDELDVASERPPGIRSKLVRTF